MQELDNSCGIASLATILHYHLHDERWDERGLIEQFMRRASTEELAEAMKKGL